MKTEQNTNREYCDCNFDWVVVDEFNLCVFGSNIKEECDRYIENFPR
jgi:hypothetical protein